MTALVASGRTSFNERRPGATARRTGQPDHSAHTSPCSEPFPTDPIRSREAHRRQSDRSPICGGETVLFERWHSRRAGSATTLLAGFVVAATAAAGIASNGGWTAPARFDGAGYAVLAQALDSGQGYRAIDHPDRPRHAHFPPGYPVLLALTWRATGRSLVAAHCVSALCTIGAALAGWCWFRRVTTTPSTFFLGMALAVNWLWVRTGNAILSEPLYLLLCQLVMLTALPARNRPELPAHNLATLCLLLALCLLTRQVALGLLIAVLIDLAWRRSWRNAMIVAAATSVLVSPWLVWMAVTARAQARRPGCSPRGGHSGRSDSASKCSFTCSASLTRSPVRSWKWRPAFKARE